MAKLSPLEETADHSDLKDIVFMLAILAVFCILHRNIYRFITYYFCWNVCRSVCFKGDIYSHL